MPGRRFRLTRPKVRAHPGPISVMRPGFFNAAQSRKFDPVTIISQKDLMQILSLLIMIIIVTLIVIFKHYVTYG